MPKTKTPKSKPWQRRLAFWKGGKPHRLLGPGLITGAADDDPSGIATYSQAGAQFGYGLLWTLPFTYPLMSGIQEISARIGRVTGQGVAANLRQHFTPWLVIPGILLFVVANVINLGADIAAMGAALNLLLPGPVLAYSAGFVLLSLVLQLSFSYSAYARVLKLLTLSLLMYFGVLFVIDLDWLQVAQGLVPQLNTSQAYLTALVAVFGTTISPYLFFWQASEEVEDTKHDPEARHLKEAPEQAQKHLRRIRIDTLVGMGFSNLTAFFIVLTCAVTLHQAGTNSIQSADQAAQALQPIAGDAAFVLFALGIIGTGLLALPILAGSAAYAIGEVLQWKVGLDRRFGQARGFYAIIIAATLVALALNLMSINPVQALVGAAIINGIVAPPLMALIVMAASHPKVMGRFVLHRPLKILGWTVVTIMSLAALTLLATSLF